MCEKNMIAQLTATLTTTAAWAVGQALPEGRNPVYLPEELAEHAQGRVLIAQALWAQLGRVLRFSAEKSKDKLMEHFAERATTLAKKLDYNEGLAGDYGRAMETRYTGGWVNDITGTQPLDEAVRNCRKMREEARHLTRQIMDEYTPPPDEQENYAFYTYST